MKYRHIIIGTPNISDWSFVRGTSVEKAVEFLVDGELAKKHPGILDEKIFHVYGALDFPKTHDFSREFNAQNKDYVFLPAEAYAKEHAFHDYLSNKFNHLYESEALPDNDYFYEHIEFKNYRFAPEKFYEKYSSELKHEELGLEEIKKSFNFASKHKGVLMYFNDNLLKNEISPDERGRLNRQFNSVKIHSDSPINLECITAIQPLSSTDDYELRLFVKYMKKDAKENTKRSYFSTLFR